MGGWQSRSPGWPAKNATQSAGTGIRVSSSTWSAQITVHDPAGNIHASGMNTQWQFYTE